MRYKRTNARKKVELVFEAAVATATRAMRAENRHFPVIETRFQVARARNEEGSRAKLDEVVFYLDLDAAVALHAQLTHSLQAAIPSIARGAGSYQYGE